MPHVEGVVSAILFEVERILRRLRLIRPARIADAVAVGPLQAGGQPLAEAPVERGLQRVIMIGSAAGLVIDLGEPGAELAYVAARPGYRIGGHTDDPVCPGTQEEIPPLAPDIGDREHRAA